MTIAWELQKKKTADRNAGRSMPAQVALVLTPNQGSQVDNSACLKMHQFCTGVRVQKPPLPQALSFNRLAGAVQVGSVCDSSEADRIRSEGLWSVTLASSRGSGDRISMNGTCKIMRMPDSFVSQIPTFVCISHTADRVSLRIIIALRFAVAAAAAAASASGSASSGSRRIRSAKGGPRGLDERLLNVYTRQCFRTWQ
eukprot:6181592-Pleurochrysis_carterae.AAC.2